MRRALSFPTENYNPRVYSVSELTEEIRALLENSFNFVWLEGEISNFSSPLSGHYYMVIKDQKSRIRAVMFRLQARYLKFLPENGMKVIVQGRIGVYPPRGEYQIILDYIEPMGFGALALAFDQLKKKLAAQGFFDEKIKKPLPFLPQRVAVITSPTGAAIRDFLNVIHRRFANIEIIVVPARVQGEEAATEIVNALELVNNELKVDVIVLTRGGGSLEDLIAFNQEEPALAIRRSQIPVVSAVGHEIDVTISDLAADFRAPTPSAAAELLVIEKESLTTRLDEMRLRLISGISSGIKNRSERLEALSRDVREPGKRLADTWMRIDEIYSRLVGMMRFILRYGWKRLSAEERALGLNSPANIMASAKQRLDFQKQSITRAMDLRLAETHTNLSFMEKRLEDLSPLSILNRGYSITRKLPEKMILTDVSSVGKGDLLQVLLAEGELECSIDRVVPDKKY